MFYSLVSESKNPQPSLVTLRRSAAELLAAAVLELFPNTLLVKGESYDLGFSYEFVFPQKFSEHNLLMIEERMRAIIKEKRPITSSEMMCTNARQFFLDKGQRIKAEILGATQDAIIDVMRMGDFVDVCPEPYVEETSQLAVFKIHKFSEKTITLPSRQLKVIRISGTVFYDKQSMKKFLKIVELSKKRDHRKLGTELNLFGVQECAGAGLWFWYPKGAVIRDILTEWWNAEHKKQQFQKVYTPDVVKASLLKESGFFDIDEQRQRNIFPTFSLEDGDYLVAPTRAPLHALIFRSSLHSYRELPIRYAECSNLYSHEKRSQLRGMLKARAYCVDDACVFCTADQVRDEVISFLQFINKTIKIFGFEYKWCLTTRGRRYAGAVSQWREYEKLFTEALTSLGFDYELDERANAFLGPEVHVMLKDALGREWDGPYVGMDFNHPQRLGLKYQGADGDMHTPMMMRRSMFGSLERFIAILVEHYAGVFPLWITPEQVRILPVSEKNEEYAEKVRRNMESRGLRVGVDYRQEKLGAKMRTAQCEKVPYILVVGEEEENKQMVAVRPWNRSDTRKVGVEAFIEKILEEATTKKIMIRDPGE